MQDPVDVLVAGGGPGGCACALMLRAHAPGLSVALAEASDYAAPRVGETLPPAAGTVLRHLGVWDAFLGHGHAPAYATAAAWGAPAAHENDFLFSARGAGWHLDRAVFDARLAEQAETRGVSLLRETRVLDAAREPDGWRVRLSSGGGLRARFLVDATGAGAALARRSGGARARVEDRLAGFVRFFRQASGGGTPHTLVEAFAGGWWYTAPLPDGRRVVACMTDTDVARGLALDEEAAWHDLLRETAPHVSGSLAGSEPSGGPVVRAARSRRLEPAAGDGWLAVGDAGSTFDPLSSQGILKALRSGIFGAYAVGDLLAKGDDSGVRRYTRFIGDEWEGYLRTRTAFYTAEARWPDHEFWRRRRGEDGRGRRSGASAGLAGDLLLPRPGLMP